MNFWRSMKSSGTGVFGTDMAEEEDEGGEGGGLWLFEQRE